MLENPTEIKLKKFLNLFWLRPENGLLCTFKSETFKDVNFESPSIDISCGDGLFMFIHFGGILDNDFDYFQSTSAKQFKHSSFIDIYDHYKKNYTVKIIKRPDKTIDYGTDWKQALLDKAARLNLHKKLILHDNNVTPLPVDDNYFQTVYSNSFYWVKNVENLLLDVYRMLRPDGVAILEVATPYFYETLNELERYLSPEAITLLDRNRRGTSPGMRVYKDWKELMEKCGFTIEDVRCVYPDKILMTIWNIGLRPISHLLVRMSDNLDINERHKIKQEWVDIFYDLFKPLLNLNLTYSLDEAPYLMFKLRKHSTVKK